MKKAILIVAILAASSSVFAAFQLGMSPGDVGSEVKARYTKGDNLVVIATAAKAVNVVASVLAPELIKTGNTAEDVFKAMIEAGYYPFELEDILPPTAAGIAAGAFSSSRASTIGGGGAASVSKS